MKKSIGLSAVVAVVLLFVSGISLAESAHRLPFYKSDAHYFSSCGGSYGHLNDTQYSSSSKDGFGISGSQSSNNASGRYYGPSGLVCTTDGYGSINCS